jgi:transketolase
MDAMHLRPLARRARELILDMAASPRGCHLGGSLSVIDILIAAYGAFRSDPDTRIVLSKGHAAAALYAALHVHGILEINPAPRYGLVGEPFTGHPGPGVPGVTFPTGSLGHGVPCALGWALGQKLKGTSGMGIAVVGDGELQEGLCWESFQIAQAKGIDNFVVIVDVNGGQNDGRVEEISSLGDLEARLSSFGFTVEELDGHDLEALSTSLLRHRERPFRPLGILARTIKAKGVPELEGSSSSHYVVINRARAMAWKRNLQ